MPELGDKPIEPQFAEQMQAIMKTLDGIFNPGQRAPNKDIGIILLVFPYGEKEGRCNYISNGADRKDVAIMLREQAARFEGQPEVKGHA